MGATVSKKEAKQRLAEGKKDVAARLAKVDKDVVEWEKRASEADDAVAAQCYREQASTVARLRSLEEKSLRLRLEALEAEVATAETE